MTSHLIFELHFKLIVQRPGNTSNYGFLSIFFLLLKISNIFNTGPVQVLQIYALPAPSLVSLVTIKAITLSLWNAFQHKLDNAISLAGSVCPFACIIMWGRGYNGGDSISTGEGLRMECSCKEDG